MLVQVSLTSVVRAPVAAEAGGGTGATGVCMNSIVVADIVQPFRRSNTSEKLSSKQQTSPTSQFEDIAYK